MTKLEYITAVEMPDYALPYVINGDASGYEDEEIVLIDEAISSLNDETGIKWGGLVFDYDEDSLGFSMRPFFGLGSTTYTTKIYGHRKETQQ